MKFRADTYPQRKLLQNVPEDTKSHTIEAEGKRLTYRPLDPLGPHVILCFDIGSSTAS